jgi:hypothetical protein
MAAQFLDSFCNWLAATPVSQTIQTIDWIVPAVQTIHILSVAAVVSSALMINLRLLGVRSYDQSVARVAARFLPFIWWPLLMLLATGTILIVAEPARALQNPVFLLKMGLLIGAAGVTLACQLPIRSNAAFWEQSPRRRRAGQLIASMSIPLWIGIICAGRWIAYVQGS